MIYFDTYWLAFVIGVVLPAVVALVAKSTATGTWKSLLLLALSAIGGTLASIQAKGGTFDWKDAATSTVVTFGTAVIAHFGLLKPMQITGGEGVIASKVPGGIG